jgi:hypothetical protein
MPFQTPTRRTPQLGIIILIALMLSASGLVAQAAGVIDLAFLEEAHGARREVRSAAEIDQPAISAIDSPSAVCYKPDSSRDTCYITWSYLYVTASVSQYVISMTVSIDNHLRAYHAGFFQTSMYLPGSLFGRGFKVACGPRNAAGMGNTHAYTLRARDTGGTTAANFGSVQCPGVYLADLPLVSR